MTAGPTDLSALGHALSAPSRARMVELLLDGQAHPIGDLAQRVGIAPATASGHLRVLDSAGLVTVVRAGRQRLVRLVDADVASALESLARPALSPVTSLRLSREQRRVQAARTCYDHLAGRYGVAWMDLVTARGWLRSEQLTTAGRTGFSELGVDLEAAECGRRPLIRTCIDWTEQRPHLAGALGASLADLAFTREWVRRTPGGRGLAVTDAGHEVVAELN